MNLVLSTIINSFDELYSDIIPKDVQSAQP